jgi:N-acylneuraminate cytidylyltransferase
MILAVIPARGGSKRLPRKNVMGFAGRPLLAWSVLLAKKCEKVMDCVVSTEDPEVAAVARAAGARVIDRPQELAEDDSSIIEVIAHAAEQVQRDGGSFKGVMLLQPTNPLRPVDMVERAIDRFLDEPCDALMAVSRRPLKLGKVVDGLFVPDYPFGKQSRHMGPAYYENGLLYLTKSDVLIERRSLTGDRVLALETERPFDEVDIDEPVDHVIGEAIYRAVGHQLGY